MITTIFLIGLLAGLFLLSFLTKRRFGVLGLSLAAGAVISTNWTSTLTPLLEQQGVHIVSPPLGSLVAAALVLLPPALLLFSGPTYNGMWPRILGAAAFALLAFAFLLNTFGTSLQLDRTSLALYAFFSNSQSAIIIGGLIGAIVDVLFTRSPKRGRSSH